MVNINLNICLSPRPSLYSCGSFTKGCYIYCIPTIEYCNNIVKNYSPKVLAATDNDADEEGAIQTKSSSKHSQVCDNWVVTNVLVCSTVFSSFLVSYLNYFMSYFLTMSMPPPKPFHGSVVSTYNYSTWFLTLKCILCQ